jgi:hypothetical protein
MKKTLNKLEKLCFKIDKHFKNDYKKESKKLTKVLKKLLKNKDSKKASKALLKISKKLKKELKNYIFNSKQEEILKRILETKKENSSAVDNFWNELAITQMAAGVGPSVKTESMKKALNGDKKASKKIMKEIDVKKAAYEGFFYLRNQSCY